MYDYKHWCLFPIGSTMWPLRCLWTFSRNWPLNVCDAQINSGWVTLDQNFMVFPWSKSVLLGSAETANLCKTDGQPTCRIATGEIAYNKRCHLKQWKKNESCNIIQINAKILVILRIQNASVIQNISISKKQQRLLKVGLTQTANVLKKDLVSASQRLGPKLEGLGLVLAKCGKVLVSISDWKSKVSVSSRIPRSRLHPWVKQVQHRLCLPAVQVCCCAIWNITLLHFLMEQNKQEPCCCTETTRCQCKFWSICEQHDKNRSTADRRGNINLRYVTYLIYNLHTYLFFSHVHLLHTYNLHCTPSHI